MDSFLSTHKNRHLSKFPKLSFKKFHNSTMEFLQGKLLIHKENEAVSAEVALKKKVLILFYFTSGNSEPCRTFDVKLKEVYHEALYRRVELAVVVISMDLDKESFTNNIKTNYYDWYAAQFEDDLGPLLMYNYGVTHIPTLIVVRKNGVLVTKEGRGDIEKIGINVLVTWSE